MSEILSECLASAHPQLPRIPLHWSIFHLRRMMYMMITSRKVNQVNTIHQVWSHPWSLLLIFSEFFETQKTQSYQCLTRLECSSLSRYYRQQRSEMRSLTCDCVRLLICHRFALSGHFHLPATCALQLVKQMWPWFTFRIWGFVKITICNLEIIKFYTLLKFDQSQFYLIESRSAKIFLEHG